MQMSQAGGPSTAASVAVIMRRVAGPMATKAKAAMPADATPGAPGIRYLHTSYQQNILNYKYTNNIPPASWQ